MVDGYFQHKSDTKLKFTLTVEMEGHVWIQPFHDDGNNRADEFLLQFKLKEFDSQIYYNIMHQ